MRPEPEAAGTNSHLGRGCGRSGRRLLRALGHAPTGALPRVLVASCGSARPASQSASFVRRPRAPGVVSCARSATHRRGRSLPCSSPPQARIYRLRLASRARMRPIRASSPARVRSRIDGCAPSRARRLLRLGTPRIPICVAGPVDPGFGSARPASQSASSDRWIRAGVESGRESARQPRREPLSSRKVRAPQSTVPGNTRSGQPEGECHRKYTA